jgi:hypothetical protein
MSCRHTLLDLAAKGLSLQAARQHDALQLCLNKHLQAAREHVTLQALAVEPVAKGKCLQVAGLRDTLQTLEEAVAKGHQALVEAVAKGQYLQTARQRDTVPALVEPEAKGQ